MRSEFPITLRSLSFLPVTCHCGGRPI